MEIKIKLHKSFEWCTNDARMMRCNVRELVKQSKVQIHGEWYNGAGDSGGRPSASGGKGDDTEEEPEIHNDVQVVNKGDMHGLRGNKDYESMANL